nr:hypothetical protein [Pandoravirus massiliensis]
MISRRQVAGSLRRDEGGVDALLLSDYARRQRRPWCRYCCRAPRDQTRVCACVRKTTKTSFFSVSSSLSLCLFLCVRALLFYERASVPCACRCLLRTRPRTEGHAGRPPREEKKKRKRWRGRKEDARTGACAKQARPGGSL